MLSPNMNDNENKFPDSDEEKGIQVAGFDYSK